MIVRSSLLSQGQLLSFPFLWQVVSDQVLDHRARDEDTAGMKTISYGPHELCFPAVSLYSPSQSRRLHVRHGCVRSRGQKAGEILGAVHK